MESIFFFTVQLKFCRQKLPIPNIGDRCSNSEQGKTEDGDMVRYADKEKHTDKIGKQDLRLF